MNKIYTHCFDAGHGGTDPGALGKSSKEANVALAIVKICEKIMLEQGQKVLLTRTTDKYLTLAQRADIANKALCSTFTSIHCNSNKGIPANGVETFSHPTSANGFKLSNCVQNELVNATKLKDRGCKTANYGVLRMSNMVAILIETAFINNNLEEVLLIQSFYQEKIALAIVKGIFKYLGLDFKEEIKPLVVNQVGKVDYCLEFQKFYNKVTQTSAQLTEDGIYGNKTYLALNVLEVLIKK